MIGDLRKTPWPWFGGKADAAPFVWSALGDVPHFVEPFCGGLAVLLRRPHPCNRAYFSETVNDQDGLLINSWRAIQMHPDATAEAASNPVAECIPTGTMISTPNGDMPVESIRAGMIVWGHNGKEVVETTVLQTRQSEVSQELVQVGGLQLTGNHPVWTEELGYQQAMDLMAGCHISMIECYDNQNMPVLRSGILSPTGPFRWSVGTPKILYPGMSREKPSNVDGSHLPGMQNGVYTDPFQSGTLFDSLPGNHDACAGKAVRYLSKALSRPAWKQAATLLFSRLRQEIVWEKEDREVPARGHRRKKYSGSPSENECLAALSQPPISRSCGEAQGNFVATAEGLSDIELQTGIDSPSKNAGSCAGVANRSNGCHQSIKGKCQATYRKGDVSTASLQARYCRSDLENRCGSRWWQPSSPAREKTRSETRREADGIRLEDSSIHQPGSVERPRRSGVEDCGSRQVHNFQTTTGNYFAAGILVHNCDLMARHLALVKWKKERNLELLMADPTWCDPVMAGWWLWGICSWIGGGWCDGTGPWIVGADGRIRKQPKGKGREPGVSNQLPHLSDDGMGVSNAGTREPGVTPGTPEHPWEEADFHPQTMPELRRWFAFLSARLRHVRILNGDWTRAVTTGAAHTLSVRQGHGPCGVFLDPPYSMGERDPRMYATDTAGLAEKVRAWCRENGGNKKYRIVLAGFAGEGHEELDQHGWRVKEWFRAGHLKGGMGQLARRYNDGEGDEGEATHQQHRERLWMSPHCVGEARSLLDGL